MKRSLTKVAGEKKLRLYFLLQLGTCVKGHGLNAGAGMTGHFSLKDLKKKTKKF